MQSYAIWNNKGGTGKSTITFHVASRFAEKHPNRKVLVIDLCPQANASMLLLGGGVTGEDRLLSLCSEEQAKSVVGYISEYLNHPTNQSAPDVSRFYTKVCTLNEQMPDNLYLLCGDGNLEIMTPAIIEQTRVSPRPGFADPWKLRKSLPADEWTIFIDTNPSFSVYTELAIFGATRLLIPVNADDSSRVAVKALFALIHGTTPPHPFFGNYTFAAQAANRSIPLPQVHLAIGNRFTQFKGPAAAYAAFSDATAAQLFSEFSVSPGRFSTRSLSPTTKETFEAAYVGKLRDFNTAGVVAAHHGTPLSKMKQDYYPVHSDPDVKVNKSQITAGLEAIDAVVVKIDP
jgi:cellulose biosynthesis protein BcsQ